jgi:hypothetical protein
MWYGGGSSLTTNRRRELASYRVIVPCHCAVEYQVEAESEAAALEEVAHFDRPWEHVEVGDADPLEYWEVKRIEEQLPHPANGPMLSGETAR